MSLHVALQTVALGEGLLTHGASVGSLPTVGPHVDRQVGLASARFAADRTHKRLVSRVDLHVIVQVNLALEGPATVWAVVRRLASVDPGVDGQLAFGAEALPTLAAVERLLLGVGPEVDLQLLAAQEHFAADVAEVRPLSVGVDLLMLSQRPWKLEAPPADLAAVWSLLGVGHLVAAQRSGVAEPFAALTAEAALPACGASAEIFAGLFSQDPQPFTGAALERPLPQTGTPTASVVSPQVLRQNRCGLFTHTADALDLVRVIWGPSHEGVRLQRTRTHLLSFRGRCRSLLGGAAFLRLSCVHVFVAATVPSRQPLMLHLLGVLLGWGRICGHGVSVQRAAADGDTGHVCFASAEMMSPANRDVTWRDHWCHQPWVRRGQAAQVSRGPPVPAHTAQPSQTEPLHTTRASPTFGRMWTLSF